MKTLSITPSNHLWGSIERKSNGSIELNPLGSPMTTTSVIIIDRVFTYKA